MLGRDLYGLALDNLMPLELSGGGRVNHTDMTLNEQIEKPPDAGRVLLLGWRANVEPAKVFADVAGGDARKLPARSSRQARKRRTARS